MISIDRAPTLTGTLRRGVLNDPCGHAFTVDGNPFPAITFTAILPDGLTLSEAGVLSGTPTKAEIFTFTVTTSNDVGAPAVLENVTVEITENTPPASGSLGSLGAIFGS